MSEMNSSVSEDFLDLDVSRTLYEDSKEPREFDEFQAVDENGSGDLSIPVETTKRYFNSVSGASSTKNEKFFETDTMILQESEHKNAIIPERLTFNCSSLWAPYDGLNMNLPVSEDILYLDVSRTLYEDSKEPREFDEFQAVDENGSGDLSIPVETTKRYFNSVSGASSTKNEKFFETDTMILQESEHKNAIIPERLTFNYNSLWAPYDDLNMNLPVSEDILDLDVSRSLYDDLELNDSIIKSANVCSVKTQNLRIRRSKSFTYESMKFSKKSKAKGKKQRQQKINKRFSSKRVVPKMVVYMYTFQILKL